MATTAGTVCVVTGASRGIGKGIALELIKGGATCYITGRNRENLNKVKDEVNTLLQTFIMGFRD